MFTNKIPIQYTRTISKLVFGKYFCTFLIYDTNFHFNFRQFEIHQNLALFEIKTFEIQILPLFQKIYISKIICFTQIVWWRMKFEEVKGLQNCEKFLMKLEGKSLLIYQTIFPPNFSTILQCLSHMCGDLCSNFLCNCYTL